MTANDKIVFGKSKMKSLINRMILPLKEYISLKKKKTEEKYIKMFSVIISGQRNYKFKRKIYWNVSSVSFFEEVCPYPSPPPSVHWVKWKQLCCHHTLPSQPGSRMSYVSWVPEPLSKESRYGIERECDK